MRLHRRDGGEVTCTLLSSLYRTSSLPSSRKASTYITYSRRISARSARVRASGPLSAGRRATRSASAPAMPRDRSTLRPSAALSHSSAGRFRQRVPSLQSVRPATPKRAHYSYVHPHLLHTSSPPRSAERPAGGRSSFDVQWLKVTSGCTWGWWGRGRCHGDSQNHSLRSVRAWRASASERTAWSPTTML